MPYPGAMDAITPAIERWKRIVIGDRRWTMLLKLGLVALLAEISGGGGGGFNFPGRTGHWPHSGDTAHALPATQGLVSSTIIAAVLAAVVVGLIVSIVVLYLSCRMKLVQFHIAVTGDRSVAQPWRMYGRQAWRLFWASLVVWLVCLALLAAIALPVLLAAWHRDGGGISPGAIFALVLLILPVVIFVFLFAALSMVVVRDLMVPAIALEDADIPRAWALARSIIESSYKSFAGYVLVKVGIRIVTAIMAGVAIFLCVLVSAIPFGVLAAVIYFTLHNISHIAMLVCFVVGGVIGLLWLVLVVAITQGLLFWVPQCYAVEWVAGRYPPLAGAMVRFAPVPVAPAGFVPPLTPPAPVGPA